MSYFDEHPRECELVTPELAELALGTLSGRRRYQLLNHVECCDRCGVELRQLSFVADTLLQLAPESDPPLGFEQRLFDRFQGSVAERRPKRLRRFTALSAVAVLMLVLGFGLGTIAAPRSSTSNHQSTLADLTSASLISRGRVFGEVFVSQGRPEWIFMSIDNRARSGTMRCDVILPGGRVETIGTFNLFTGYGGWGAQLKSPVLHVRVVQILTPDETVLATAVLSA